MKNSIKTLATWLIIGVIFVILISSLFDSSNNKLAYSDLVAKIDAGEVKEIEISSDGTKAEVKLKNENLVKQVNIPSMDNLMETLQESMKSGTVKVSEKSESIFMFVLSLLTPFGILIIFFIFWFLFMNSGNQANGSRKGHVFWKEQSKNASAQQIKIK